MSASNPADWAEQFQSLARQYWQSWGDFARQSGGSAAASPGQGFQQAIDWWSRLAHGGREEANLALEQFNRQMRHGYGLMQELAGTFAGQSASAKDIASAWRQAIGANGVQPFPELFKSFHGRGLDDIERWLADASPLLASARDQISQSLRLPTFGFSREHQERWQRLARAQIDYQEQTSRYQALLARAGENAFVRFEALLAERDEPGRQLTSARALFDLWIDAAEDAYAEIALSDEFRSVYGELVNSQMRLRAAVQTEVEHAARAFGMPTRTEVQASHAKVHALERELRRLRARLDALEAGSRTSTRSNASTVTRHEPGGDDPHEFEATTVPAAPTAVGRRSPSKAGRPAPSPRPARSSGTRGSTAVHAEPAVIPAPAHDWWGSAPGTSGKSTRSGKPSKPSISGKSGKPSKSATASTSNRRSKPASNPNDTAGRLARPTRPGKPAKTGTSGKTVRSRG